jgi:hypothetical protein
MRCGFGISNGYGFLNENVLPQSELDVSHCRVLKRVWESLTPMKVKIFSWELMLQRMPIRANLALCGVLMSPTQAQCVWCSSKVESKVHLFTKCYVAVEVLLEIYSWLG